MASDKITIADLQLQITSNSSQVVKGLDALTEALERLKGVTGTGLGLDKVSSQLSQLTQSMGNLSSVGNIKVAADGSIKQAADQAKEFGENIKDDTSAVQQFSQETSNIDVNEALQGLNNINIILMEISNKKSALADALEANDADKILQLKKQLVALQDRYVNLMYKAGDAEQKVEAKAAAAAAKEQEKKNKSTKEWLQTLIQANAAQQKEEEYKKAYDGFNVDNYLRGTKEIDVVKSKIKELKLSLRDAFAKGDKQKVNQYTSQIKKLQQQLGQTKKPAKETANAFTKILKSFGRIAFYRLVRSVIKEITAALKEGITNIYQFEKETDGGFAQSMDTIATAILSIRNSLGAALAPFIQMIAPMIEQLADKFMALSNKIAEVGAVINGQTTYTKATKSLKEYAEATDKAKSATQGFDELNIADKGTDVSTMFETVEVGELEGDTQDLYNIISSIKQVITDVVGIIKDDIMPILSPILNLVSTIAKIVLDAIHEILSSEEIKELLTLIGDVIASVIKMIMQNMPTIKRIIEVIVKLVNMIVGAVGEIIGDGIEKGETGMTHLFTLIEGIVSLIEIVLDLIQPILDIVVRIVSLVTGIVDMVLKAVQPILEGIFDILQPIVRLVVDLLVSALEPIAPILDVFVELIGGVLSPILEEMGVFLKPLLEWIQNALTTIGGLIGGIAKFFSGVLTDAIQGVVLVFKAFVALFSGDTEKIKDAWSAVGEHFKDVWKRMWDNIKNVFVKIINGIIGGFEKFVNALIDAVNWLTDKFSKIWTWTGLDGIPQASHVTFNRLNGYAQGGYGIPKGQMFIASERGAEMVGSMDGKTAVANNQQIIEGIKQGVYEAFMSAMESQPDKDGNINLSVYLDGRQIKSEIDRISQSNGVSIAGGLAYYG